MKTDNKILESLPEDFFKRFKTGNDFTGFMDGLFDDPDHSFCYGIF